MSRADKFFTACMFVYAIGVPATWGWIWGRLPECGAITDQTTITESSEIQGCHGGNAFALIFGSAFWPIYVIGHTASEQAK